MKPILILLAVSTIASSGRGQTSVTPTAAAPASALRSMRAVRTNSAITLDGRLAESSWGTATAATQFTQSYPKADSAGTERTEVRVVYDDDALYVGVRMFDSNPGLIAAQLARRDATGIFSDWVHVAVDSYHDRRTAFRFSVNPKGVQKDVLHTDDRNEDLNWDAVWQVATAVDSLGWVAEYRIPFSQLRFGGSAKGAERVWGIQVQREIARKNERVSWSPWKPNDPGYVSYMGDLTGIVDIPTPRRLEVMPYVSSKLARAPGDKANPFYRQNDFSPSAGADLKYGLPGGFTLTATANPDFGQVEVDPAVVNLSAFESFFPEKRPFFVEGSSIFNLGRVRGGPNFGQQQIFYSRRIGRAPQRSAGGRFVDAPDASTIYGAAKVSGKSGPWTVGLLNAVTAKENARTIDATNVETSTPVEPLTNYFVGRVRRDFNKANTIVSLGATSVNRDLSDPVFKNLLRSRAQVGALDFEHQWDNRKWALTGAAAMSHIGGAVDVITRAQRSSARYYQRPDADYLELDSASNSLGGHSLSLGLNKSGDWSMAATLKQVSPGYEVNDLGFMGRVDYRNFGIGTNYYSGTPGKIFREFSFGGGMNHVFNFGGDRLHSAVFGHLNLTFNNLWYAGGGMELNPRRADDRLTRGGPVADQPMYYGAYLYGGTDSRKSVSYRASGDNFTNTEGGYNRSVDFEVTVRPSTSVSLSFSPDLSFSRHRYQYVSTVTDAAASQTFGARYVFADLFQTTLSANTRMSWTISPTLSFEMYAQPFASVGRYEGFKELARPRSLDYNVYGTGASTIQPEVDPASRKTTGFRVDPDGTGTAAPFSIRNPDFRLHSLRGNGVVRWEFRPGSALFFVWQQERSGFTPFEGDFRTGRDIREIFGRPSNVFLVKATYWFAR